MVVELPNEIGKEKSSNEEWAVLYKTSINLSLNRKLPIKKTVPQLQTGGSVTGVIGRVLTLYLL